MNPVSKIRKDYAHDRFVALDKLETEVRSAKVECYVKAGLAGERHDAAVEDAWAAYHASPLASGEARAQLHASLDAAAKGYEVAETESMRVCAEIVGPATAAYAIAMAELAAARNRALEAG